MTSPAPFRSATIPQERLLPGIHGLRGIAALAVVLFHLVHIANIKVPVPFIFIAGDFGKGVHLFFLLSAFSLMHSTEHTLHRPTWMTEYFVKRFFRIAPLFYCILAGMVIWPSIKAHYLAVNPQVLLLNLTFTFGFAPWAGIVLAGWTVGVEMIFYAILPVLLLTVRSSKGTLVLVLASLLISYASRSVLHVHFQHTASLYGDNWAYYSFTPNLCFFALGIYAFRIAADGEWNIPAMRLGVSAFATCLILALLFGGRYNGWRPDILLWGFGFAALALWQSKWPSRWCANKFFEYVGERSYSVYLLHPVVIIILRKPLQSLYGMLTPSIGAYAYFACAGLVLLTLLVFSEASYRLVEIPGIRYGQRINARIRARQSASK